MKHILCLALGLFVANEVEGRGFGGGSRGGGGGNRGGGVNAGAFQGTGSFSGGQRFEGNYGSRSAGQYRGGYVPNQNNNFNQVNRGNFTQNNRNNFNQLNRNDFNRTNVNQSNRNDFNRTNVNQFNRNDFNRTNVNQFNRQNVNIGNRENININQRPNWNVNQGNVNVVNRSKTNVNQSVNVNRNVYANRPVYTNRPVYGYHNWHRGYWTGWGYWPTIWGGPVVDTGWFGPTTTNIVYANPYVVSSPSYIVESPALNYAQPIPAPPQQVDAPPPADPDDPPPQNFAPPAAEKDFDAARAAFKKGDYRKAQEDVEKALAVLPSDAVLHEFRALTLFAQKKYKEAASVIYAVLSAGPGWDWQTMSELYDDPKTYTKQLRDLEQYQRDNPKAPDGHFLLAYHYLVLGYKDQAIKQLQDVVSLQPNDKLSAELLKSLTQKESDRPAPSNP